MTSINPTEAPSGTPPLSVLVIQAWGIGDLVMTTPLLRALRKQWPSTEIILATGSETAAQLLRGSDLVDHVLVTPKGRGFRLIRWTLGLRSRAIDLAILATRQHWIWPSMLRLLAGIPFIAADSPHADSIFVNYHRQVHLSDEEHRIESNMELLRAIVGDVRSPLPLVTISAGDHSEAQFVLEGLGVSPRDVLVGVHPGSEPRIPQKRFPGLLLREALLQLMERSPKTHVLVFFGGELVDERALYSDLSDRIHVVTDVAIRTVAALSAQCDAFLAGDTGLAHIADALDVPVVIIAGPTQVRSTAARGRKSLIVATEQPLDCMPCYGTPLYGACSHVSCMTTLSPTRVVDAVLDVLRRWQARDLGPIQEDQSSDGLIQIQHPSHDHL